MGGGPPARMNCGPTMGTRKITISMKSTPPLASMLIVDEMVVLTLGSIHRMTQRMSAASASHMAASATSAIATPTIGTPAAMISASGGRHQQVPVAQYTAPASRE